jgi:hypothetical protein
VSPRAGKNLPGNGSKPAIDLTIWGISDSELLGIVDDLADENGWTRGYDVRLQLGENIEERGRRSGVGPRLSWMVRYGWLEKGEPQRDEETGNRFAVWRLTAMGHALLDDPRLARSVENALEKMNPAQRLALTRELGEFGSHTALEIRSALRRQWQRSLGR